jgi:rare lipoprotein A
MFLNRLAVAAVLSIAAFGFGSVALAADDTQKSAPVAPPAAANPAPASPTPATAPATATPPAPVTPPAAASGTETGLAAVYGDRLNGHKTASGARYDRNRLTAAHKTLPFGTKVKVTNNRNHKSVTVIINDRGPTQAGRILDLSPRAARALGIRPTAMAEVTMEVVGAPPARAGK